MSDHQPIYDMKRIAQVGKWRNHTKKMEFVIKFHTHFITNDILL